MGVLGCRADAKCQAYPGAAYGVDGDWSTQLCTQTHTLLRTRTQHTHTRTHAHTHTLSLRDVGIYAAVTSLEPLVAYAFTGGSLVRFCSDPYQRDLRPDTPQEAYVITGADYKLPVSKGGWVWCVLGGSGVEGLTALRVRDGDPGDRF